MTLNELQNAIDAMTPLLVEKGWKQPEATLSIEANRVPRVYLSRTMADYQRDYQFIAPGDTMEETLDNAREFIADLPDPEEARKQEFITQLAALIDLGRENGIDLAFVNPLQETMKRLAENALTHEPA